MPRYDYVCERCGFRMPLQSSVADRDRVTTSCQKCGFSGLERLFIPTANISIPSAFIGSNVAAPQNEEELARWDHDGVGCRWL